MQVDRLLSNLVCWLWMCYLAADRRPADHVDVCLDRHILPWRRPASYHRPFHLRYSTFSASRRRRLTSSAWRARPPTAPRRVVAGQRCRQAVQCPTSPVRRRGAPAWRHRGVTTTWRHGNPRETATPLAFSALQQPLIVQFLWVSAAPHYLHRFVFAFINVARSNNVEHVPVSVSLTSQVKSRSLLWLLNQCESRSLQKFTNYNQVNKSSDCERICDVVG